MRKVVGAGVVLALAVAVVAVGRTLAPFGRASGTEPHVEVVRVARRDVGRVVKATGVVKPMIGAEVKVGSRVSGVVRRLFVRVGDRVEKGQLLAELDDRELVARRDQVAAALALARATMEYAAADLRRKRALSAELVIAAGDLDLAKQSYAVAEQQVKGAAASLEDATTQLGYARITAPINGVVSAVSTQEGETVAASFSAPTFVTLLDLARLEVWAYVDETDIGRIQRGQAARFTVDTYADQEFAGRVTAIYPQAEIRDNVVNYVTVVRFEPTRDRILRPEMTTTVRIALERREHVLALPLRAVRREGGRQFVLCPRGATTASAGGASPNDAFERRWITTGTKDDSYCEIVEGLREGDEVVVGDARPAS